MIGPGVPPRAFLGVPWPGSSGSLVRLVQVSRPQPSSEFLEEPSSRNLPQSSLVRLVQVSRPQPSSVPRGTFLEESSLGLWVIPPLAFHRVPRGTFLRVPWSAWSVYPAPGFLEEPSLGDLPRSRSAAPELKEVPQPSSSGSSGCKICLAS